MTYGDPELELDPPCPGSDSRAVFTAVAPPGQREMPLYPACCHCGLRARGPGRLLRRSAGIPQRSSVLAGEHDRQHPLGDLGVARVGPSHRLVSAECPSTKEPEHFRTTPGGYFHGMVAKAKVGELHLDRTVWALRRTTELLFSPRRKPSSPRMSSWGGRGGNPE